MTHYRFGWVLLQVSSLVRDQLFRNSAFILSSVLLNSLIGFVFWFEAAHLCSADDVGRASAMLSALGLILLVSKLGLNFSLVRYLPDGDRRTILWTSTITSTTVALALSLIFISLVDILSPEIGAMKSPSLALLFIVIVAGDSMFLFAGTAFNATRQGRRYLIQNAVLAVRLPLLVVLAHWGTSGIFLSFGLSILVALAVSLVFMIRQGLGPTLRIDKGYLRESFAFSASNFVASLSSYGPAFITPLIVLNQLGPASAAYYFISYSIAAFLFMIPTAIGTSMFVEGSHGTPIARLFRKSGTAMVVLLAPAIVILWIFGSAILSLVGDAYASEGISMFRAMVLSSVPVGGFLMVLSVKRIQKENGSIVVLGVVNFILLITLMYVLLGHFGLVGVGYAWILSYSLVGAPHLCALLRRMAVSREF